MSCQEETNAWGFIFAKRHAYSCAMTVCVTKRCVLAKPNKRPIFALAKRGRAQALPLFVFLGLTILYERKNYLLDSFSDVLYREKILDFRGLFFGGKFHSLNYL